MTFREFSWPDVAYNKDVKTSSLFWPNSNPTKLWKKISPDWQKTLQPQPWLSPATASKSTYRASVATRSYFPVNTDLFYKLLYLEDCVNTFYAFLLEKFDMNEPFNSTYAGKCDCRKRPLLMATVNVTTRLCKNRVL